MQQKISRAEIWEWFSSYAPPKYKIGRKKSDKDGDKYRVRYACTVRGDRLIIGMWRGHKAESVGVYYMTPTGGYYTSTDGEKWGSGKADYLYAGGWDYWCSNYKYKAVCVSGAEDAAEWLEEHFGNESFYYYHGDGDILNVVDRVETNIGYMKRRNARERKLQRLTDYCESLPPFPEDLDGWLREVVFGGLNYAFGNKDSDVYHCTACGGEHEVKGWKHRGRYECPATGKLIKVDKCKSSYSARERIMIVQSHHDMQGEICSVARHFTVEENWSESGVYARVWADAVLILPLDGRTVCGDDIIYCQGLTWSDRNTYGYTHARCYCYPDVSALSGTRYEGIGIDAAAAKGWKLHYNNLMRGCHGDPRIEYMVKGGYYSLVNDIAKVGYAYMLNNGKSVKEVLGLDGQSIARLKQADGDYWYLEWLRAAKVCGYKLSEATLRFFSQNKISPTNIAVILQCGMTPEQVGNYLQKPHGYTLKKVSKPANPQKVIDQWKDYLNMAERLKLNTHDPAVYRPKDLRARHDELVELINLQRDELERERIESEYPRIKPVCEKIRAIYEWGDGECCVVVPSGAAEIQREGRLLHHCVGSSDRYFDRIAEEESYIMFLRRTSDRDKPWYTMEVEPGGSVRQLRTMGDAEGEDRAEAKAFLAKWRREISSRMGEAEREQAEVSREKRLREFEELRRGGNIIRTGKLAGRLLVEVLEADFKEYNDEITQGA